MAKNEEFGKYLRHLREDNDFTLKRVSEIIKSYDEENTISLASLKSYERGDIEYIQPDKLKKFAKAYNIEYQEIVNKWVQTTFDLSIQTNIISSSQDIKIVDNSSNKHEREVSLISLEHLEKIQAKLTRNEEVWVYADDFLDDDKYYPMVSNNLKKGVKYTYFFSSHIHNETPFRKYVEKLLQDNINVSQLIELYDSVKGIPMNIVVLKTAKDSYVYKGLVKARRPLMYQEIGTSDSRMADRIITELTKVKHDNKINQVLSEIIINE